MPISKTVTEQKKMKPADIALAVGLVALIAIGVWMIVRENLNAAAPASLPADFVYDIEDLKSIDPALVHFEETAQFDTDMQSLLSLALHEDRVYVAGDGGLKVFNYQGNLLQTLIGGTKVSSVWVRNDNEIYVGIGNQVVIYDGDGTRGQAWEPFADRCNLRSMVGSDDTLYVADAANRVIYACGFDGRRIRDIGKNPGDGLVVPGPHLDLHWSQDDGLLYVANPGRHRIDAYTADGNLNSYWGKPSMRLEGFCGCCNPTAFALWPGGGFLTSEKGLTRIKRHLTDGSIKDVVATPQMFRKKTRIFDMDVNADGVVFVLDNDRKQVRMFTEKASEG